MSNNNKIDATKAKLSTRSDLLAEINRQTLVNVEITQEQAEQLHLKDGSIFGEHVIAIKK